MELGRHQGIVAKEPITTDSNWYGKVKTSLLTNQNSIHQI
jgi:hypothetical protein